MKYHHQLLVFAISMLFCFACSPTDEDMDEGTMRSGTLNVSGIGAIALDITGGQINSDYEATNTLEATINASQSDGDYSFSMVLTDDAESSFPFNGFGNFNITGTAIKASMMVTTPSGTVTATSGTVAVTDFRRAEELGTPGRIEISGGFNVDDGTSFFTGSFDNVLINCGECE